MPLNALQWLCEEDGPLRFRPEADLRQRRWLARFLASCNAGAIKGEAPPFALDGLTLRS